MNYFVSHPVEAVMRISVAIQALLAIFQIILKTLTLTAATLIFWVIDGSLLPIRTTLAFTKRTQVERVTKESDNRNVLAVFDVGRLVVPDSVIDAIRQGIWDFEPEEEFPREFDGTDALPGTTQKLSILAARLSDGKPLWHPEDRLTYGDHLPDVLE